MTGAGTPETPPEQSEPARDAPIQGGPAREAGVIPDPHQPPLGGREGPEPAPTSNQPAGDGAGTTPLGGSRDDAPTPPDSGEGGATPERGREAQPPGGGPQPPPDAGIGGDAPPTSPAPRGESGPDAPAPATGGDRVTPVEHPQEVGASGGQRDPRSDDVDEGRSPKRLDQQEQQGSRETGDDDRVRREAAFDEAKRKAAAEVSARLVADLIARRFLPWALGTGGSPEDPGDASEPASLPRESAGDRATGVRPAEDSGLVERVWGGLREVVSTPGRQIETATAFMATAFSEAAGAMQEATELARDARAADPADLQRQIDERRDELSASSSPRAERELAVLESVQREQHDAALADRAAVADRDELQRMIDGRRDEVARSSSPAAERELEVLDRARRANPRTATDLRDALTAIDAVYDPLLQREHSQGELLAISDRHEAERNAVIHRFVANTAEQMAPMVGPDVTDVHARGKEIWGTVEQTVRLPVVVPSPFGLTTVQGPQELRVRHDVRLSVFDTETNEFARHTQFERDAIESEGLGPLEYLPGPLEAVKLASLVAKGVRALGRRVAGRSIDDTATTAARTIDEFVPPAAKAGDEAALPAAKAGDDVAPPAATGKAGDHAVPSAARDQPVSVQVGNTRIDGPPASGYALDTRVAGDGVQYVHVDVNARRETVVSIYAEVRPQIERQHFENKIPLASQIDDLSGRDYDRFHLLGRQLGGEAAEGVMHAPKGLNIGLQAILEGQLKGMQAGLAEGERIFVRARATSYPRDQFGGATARRFEYDFAVVSPKGEASERVGVVFDIAPPTSGGRWEHRVVPGGLGQTPPPRRAPAVR